MGWFISALEVAHRLATLNEKMSALDTTRREAIATYFEAVSGTLLRISETIERKERADFLLGKLEIYGAELPQICEGVLGAEEAQKLAKELPFYYPPIDLLELHQPNEGDFSIDLVAAYARSAGAFQALADTIRVKK